MARYKPSPLFTEFNGLIGGVQFQGGPFGSFIRQKNPSRKDNPYSFFFNYPYALECLEDWNNLSDSNKSSWNLNYSRFINFRTGLYYTSGKQFFCHSDSNYRVFSDFLTFCRSDLVTYHRDFTSFNNIAFGSDSLLVKPTIFLEPDLFFVYRVFSGSNNWYFTPSYWKIGNFTSTYNRLSFRPFGTRPTLGSSYVFNYTMGSTPDIYGSSLVVYCSELLTNISDVPTDLFNKIIFIHPLSLTRLNGSNTPACWFPTYKKIPGSYIDNGIYRFTVIICSSIGITNVVSSENRTYPEFTVWPNT